jgi:hypothetical protein
MILKNIGLHRMYDWKEFLWIYQIFLK